MQNLIETTNGALEAVAQDVISQNLTPKQIVERLDAHIIGQADAKRAVAIALRNRWRRMQLPEELRSEISPKNILMIGPTGVGKTEIARRLALLANAPFIKVEATKFTEVGYVGKEVESIIKDLAQVGMKLIEKQAVKQHEEAAKAKAEERILDCLLPPPRNTNGEFEEIDQNSNTRQIFRKKLREGQLDDKEIDIDLSVNVNVDIIGAPGMDEMTNQLKSIFDNMGMEKTKKQRMKIKDAFKALIKEEAGKLVDKEELSRQLINSVEQNGIVFIDEIDKICKNAGHSGAEVSREGVQRDLLPLIEGTTVNTRYGMIKTDHILFITSGAFASSKPSDLVPELQGRLPIRVELQALNADDFKRILTEPKASLTTQYKALLQTEGVNIEFSECGIDELAQSAFLVNKTTENIGARRLHTVIERVMDKVSFAAPDMKNETVVIDREYVKNALGTIVKDEDLSRFVL